MLKQLLFINKRKFLPLVNLEEEARKKGKNFKIQKKKKEDSDEQCAKK